MVLSAHEVVRTATVIADADGFDAVTLSAVARSLGVRPPSLYSHVRDLAALRDGVTEVALTRLARRIALATSGRSGADALRGLADAHREFAREAPGQWQALQRRAGETATESEAARQVVALHAAVLSGYDLDPASFVHAVRLIGSTINGFINLESVGSFDHSAPPPTESWHRVVDSLHEVLARWASTAEPPASPSVEPPPRPTARTSPPLPRQGHTTR